MDSPVFLSVDYEFASTLSEEMFNSRVAEAVLDKTLAYKLPDL